MKWVSMAEQPQISLRSPLAMPSVCWSGVKVATFELWSNGSPFSGVMNHASPSVSTTDESGFGGWQENAFPWFWLGLLVPVKGNLNAAAYNYILDDLKPIGHLCDELER